MDDKSDDHANPLHTLADDLAKRGMLREAADAAYGVTDIPRSTFPAMVRLSPTKRKQDPVPTGRRGRNRTTRQRYKEGNKDDDTSAQKKPYDLRMCDE